MDDMRWTRDGVEMGGTTWGWKSDGRYCECGHSRPGHRGYYRPAPDGTTACGRKGCGCGAFVAEAPDVADAWNNRKPGWIAVARPDSVDR